jgi:hypothetical protein
LPDSSKRSSGWTLRLGLDAVHYQRAVGLQKSGASAPALGDQTFNRQLCGRLGR